MNNSLVPMGEHTTVLRYKHNNKIVPVVIIFYTDTKRRLVKARLYWRDKGSDIDPESIKTVALQDGETVESVIYTGHPRSAFVELAELYRDAYSKHAKRDVLKSFDAVFDVLSPFDPRKGYTSTEYENMNWH